MSCTNEPRQLDLNLKLDLNAAYQRFEVRVLKLLEEQNSDALVVELRNWAQFQDFPLVATWVKKLLRQRSQHRQIYDLLTCFGTAFRGDQVGHIGRDILTPLLGSSAHFTRGRALNVLAMWLEYDEDGMFLEMVADHLEREQTLSLRDRCEQLLEHYGVEEEEMLLEMLKDCPTCDEGHVLEMDGCWYCDGCGDNWDRDPLDRDVDPSIFALQDTFQDEPQMNDPDEDEVMEHDPRYQEYHRIRRGCDVKTRGQVPTAKLPDYLDRLLDLRSSITLGVLESLKIGHLSLPDSNLTAYMTENCGPGHILRAWDPEGSFAVSVEPTATPATWLVFAHRR